MKSLKYIVYSFGVLLSVLSFSSCQKMDRPEMGEIIQDPEPPPYNPLKSFWSFENNTNDAGENNLTVTEKNVSYVDGINGKAIQFGTDGYMLMTGIGDTVTFSNGYVSLPVDTLASPGNLSFSFWMNVPGPVDGGAQGVFSFSNGKEFWGNFDMFLENNNNTADPSEAFIKLHMYNANAPSGQNEQWSEIKVPGVLNKWTHIGITYDSATAMLNLYVDGVLTGLSKTLAGGDYGKLKYNDFKGLVIGSYQFMTDPSLTSNHGREDWAKSIKGPIDQFRIYNTALTAAEINDLFTSKD
jgi:hypothetical protein